MKNSEIKNALQALMPSSIRNYDKIEGGKYSSQYGNVVILGYDSDFDISVSIGIFHGDIKTYRFKIEVCGDTKMGASCSENKFEEYFSHFILALSEFREHLILFHRRCRSIATGNFMISDMRQVKIKEIIQ